MSFPSISIMVFGTPASGRNALAEEKYMGLADTFAANGFRVASVLYHDDVAEKLSHDLLQFAAVLVWVNPIEQGHNRKQLDKLLAAITAKGCFVSAHPEVILKMGTKEVLYTTRKMDWGGDTKMYTGYEAFVQQFPASLEASKIRVLKQYRGNGGNGVFKIIRHSPGEIKIIHAMTANEAIVVSWEEFNQRFAPFFAGNGCLIDQAWNPNTLNGMVRCYVSGTSVAGFGYQEINALYELNNPPSDIYFPPSKRYYFTENCGLFHDL